MALIGIGTTTDKPLSGHNLIRWTDNDGNPQFGCECGVQMPDKFFLPGFPELVTGDNWQSPSLYCWFAIHCTEILGAGPSEATITLADAINLGIVVDSPTGLV